VSSTEKLHMAAINLLQRLQLDNCRLEAEAHDRFRYVAWTPPQIVTNGQVKSVKRGRIKVPA
jgi:hypothetical protein